MFSFCSILAFNVCRTQPRALLYRDSSVNSLFKGATYMQQVLLQRHKMQGLGFMGSSDQMSKVALYGAKNGVYGVFTFCSYSLFSLRSVSRL
jgi:hypothetical protein